MEKGWGKKWQQRCSCKLFSNFLRKAKTLNILLVLFFSWYNTVHFPACCFHRGRMRSVWIVPRKKATHQKRLRTLILCKWFNIHYFVHLIGLNTKTYIQYQNPKSKWYQTPSASAQVYSLSAIYESQTGSEIKKEFLFSPDEPHILIKGLVSFSGWQPPYH